MSGLSPLLESSQNVLNEGDNKAVFTLHLIAFALVRKSHRVERHQSDNRKCATFSCSERTSIFREKANKEKEVWNHLRRESGLGFIALNPLGTMFFVCERLASVPGRYCSYFTMLYRYGVNIT